MDDNTVLADRFPFLNADVLQARIAWSIRLRWLAVMAYFAGTLAVRLTLDIPLRFTTIWSVLVILAGINLVYYIVFRIYRRISMFAELIILAVHISIDLILLTVLIHLSGGIENPVYLFYLFHVVLSSILFPKKTPLLFASLAVVLFSAMVWGEYSHVLPHYCILSGKLHENPVFIFLTLGVFIVTVYVSTYICYTFMHLYRDTKRQIDHKNRELVEIDRQKTQFFRFTSHELKSPIVAIKTTLDGILQSPAGEIDDRSRDLLKRASGRAGQMLAIIRELLEISRRRGGALLAEVQQFDLAEVIRDTVIGTQQEAEAHELEIAVEVPVNGISFHGSPTDMATIIENLMTNAIRYTPRQGKISITARQVSGEIELIVQDTGIGIEQAEQEKIFSEFYRSEPARQMLQFGTGLGLPLVRQIVEQYRGTVRVESRPGSGSRFIVRLPVDGEQGDGK